MYDSISDKLIGRADGIEYWKITCDHTPFESREAEGTHSGQIDPSLWVLCGSVMLRSGTLRNWTRRPVISRIRYNINGQLEQRLLSLSDQSTKTTDPRVSP